MLVTLALLPLVLLAGCKLLSEYEVKPSLTYHGQYGDYTISKDGKQITPSVHLRDLRKPVELPSGFAK